MASTKRLADGTLRLYTNQECPICKGGRLRIDMRDGTTRRYCGVCGAELPVPTIDWRP